MGAGPLSDVLVLDLTHVLAGPYCTMYLAELGARVIKVEHKGHGDDTRAFAPFRDGISIYFASVNRGKESIALDFEQPEDRALLLEMIRRADVLVENLRFVTLEHLGVDYEHLRRINPRLIYAAISGFGQRSPLRNMPAYDPIIQAIGGMMSINGQPDDPPTKVGTSLMDYLSGMFCLAGIEAALYQREKTGTGCHVDISMLDGQVAVLEAALMRALNGEPPVTRIGSRHPVITPCDSFATADRPLYVIAANDEMFVRLCAVIGRAELAQDPRFLDCGSRATNEPALKAEIERALRTRPAAEWIAVLNQATVPCGLVNSVAETIELPQLKERNMLVTAGAVRMAGNPIKMSTLPDSSTRHAAPHLDADGARIRAEFTPRKI
ncbi:MAG TPA: CoA transferase [Candidatus Binataceae bacterium]|nr:CoA transferase [Candidatus Binataceae bacterium]